MPKKSIRDEMLARRKQLAAETCVSRSLRIQKRFLEAPEFVDAKALGIYSPILNEVFTEEIFHVAHRMGKKVAYPRVRERILEFVEVSGPKELSPGSFGILEPKGSEAISPGLLDVLVVPGVAFDLAGYRLGYGKGFYDRFLHFSTRPGVLVGLCFESQIITALPRETHDVRMDMLVTEERTLRFCEILVKSHQ
jgi:5-formyltetrahydrofolate cyclo-ligase